MANKLTGKQKRKFRIRKKVNGTSERPRMSVYRSAKHIYAQVIDDTRGVTLASASTMMKDLSDQVGGSKKDAAEKVGSLIAERCKAQNITKVVFDRNGFMFHGRIKALADAARGAGLDF